MTKVLLIIWCLFIVQIYGYVEVQRFPHDLKEIATILILLVIILLPFLRRNTSAEVSDDD